MAEYYNTDDCPSCKTPYRLALGTDDGDVLLCTECGTELYASANEEGELNLRLLNDFGRSDGREDW